MKKKITIPEIARLAKVSIGTVDRAINDRPGISPKTKEKILAIAATHGYRPNRLSKALANNRTVTIGMITLPETIPFVQRLIASAQAEAEELYDYGCRLQLHSLKSLNAAEEVRMIEALIDQRVDAIAVAGLDCPDITDAVNRAAESGIPVVTFNTDVPLGKRRCFVGQDLYISGEVAADLLGKFMGKRGDLFILQGCHDVAAHCERLKGFLHVVEKEFPRINVIGIEECHEDNDIAYQKIKEICVKEPGISGIYVVASGNIGAGQAIRESGLAGQISFVCNDYVDGTKELLRDHVIDATILQDPETQGRLPVKILFDLVFDRIEPAREVYRTAIQIITHYNSPS